DAAPRRDRRYPACVPAARKPAPVRVPVRPRGGRREEVPVFAARLSRPRRRRGAAREARRPGAVPPVAVAGGVDRLGRGPGGGGGGGGRPARPPAVGQRGTAKTLP